MHELMAMISFSRYVTYVTLRYVHGIININDTLVLGLITLTTVNL